MCVQYIDHSLLKCGQMLCLSQSIDKAEESRVKVSRTCFEDVANTKP